MQALCDIVEALPGMKVLLITSLESSHAAATLKKHLQRCDGTITYNHYPDPLQVPSREFEAVIIEKVLTQADHAIKILKQAYRALENSGTLVVIDSTMSETIISMIDVCDYRTPNHIDIEGEDFIIVAKKLHMWGNGL